MRIFWYHMPHSPLGIFHITLVAGNNVNVHMVNTLPGGRPDVYADIVAVRLEFLIDALFLIVYQLHASRYLFRCQLKKTGDMALRDNQRMTWTYPVGITGTVRKIPAQ